MEKLKVRSRQSPKAWVSDEKELQLRESLWQEVVKNPKIFPVEAILGRLEWFQTRDNTRISIKLADYLNKRKKWFTDER